MQRSHVIDIAGHLVGPDHPPFLIAEMSGNHNHSLERAKDIITAAARAGAHAIKLQTYTADTMTLDCDGPGFRIENPASLWHGRQLHELYRDAHTPWEWHAPLFEHARALGIVPFSTPFDETAVDFLESLDVPCYKVASFENTDLPLIRKVAATGKPLIMSTGMATVAELDESVRAARSAGCVDLILLKCTSTYPAEPANTNIATIPHMRELFGCQVGLSDHTMGVGVGVASVMLGATVIEKHFTLRRSDGGVDSSFSMEPDEFQMLVAETRRAFQALGHIAYGPTNAEIGSLQFRRSIYVVKDLKAGDLLDTQNVRVIRPGLGLAPKHLEAVLGSRVHSDVPRGTPVTWNMLRRA
jgi:pseudaminic acid synthase